jgi:Xaa-Pro aminopeptidase
MALPDLSLDECRRRQQRLLAAAEPIHADLVVLSRMESVQWLTGVRLGPLFEVTAAMDASGRVTLVLPSRSSEVPVAADDTVGYEAKWHSTMRNDQREACSEALLKSVTKLPLRIACEFDSFDQYLAGRWNPEMADIGPLLMDLRRAKHADELAMLRFANEANRAMYEHARRIIEPGINELEVYNELQAIAVRQLGEPLTYFGQDFRSAARGGPPRDREVQPGELYILDLGVGYRGYYSDNARTLAVGGQPSDLQIKAWQQVAEVFPLVQSRVKAGVSCRAVFDEVQQLLDKCPPWVFDHHLGHGVGLAPHEGPHLNPRWDDVFEEGDFFTAEPGLYHEQLQQGVRLEQNYIVTTEGVELLTDWPLHL